MSGWLKWDDIPLKNIRKCCEVLNIQLWEFFLPEDAPVPDYVSLGFSEDSYLLYRAIEELPEKQRMFIYKMIGVAMTELFDKEMDRFKNLNKNDFNQNAGIIVMDKESSYKGNKK